MLIDVFNKERLNPPDEECRVCFQCSECGEPIREGDDYVRFGENCYCDDCVTLNSDIAVFEEDEW